MSQNRKTQLRISMRRCVVDFFIFMSCAGKLYELKTRPPPTAHDNIYMAPGKKTLSLFEQ